jgi:hypothetical protein
MRNGILLAVCLAFVCSEFNALEAQEEDLAFKGVDIAPDVVPTPQGPAGTPQLQVEGKNVITQDAFALSAVLSHSRNDLQSMNDHAVLSGDDEFVTVTMPFSVEFGGVSYSTISISTNGWILFGTADFSDRVNDCLPSDLGSNPDDPFLAAYWDDLFTVAGAVQYGWVGVAPNRTFIVDWETRKFGFSDSVVAFQAQIHETSSLLNVKYLGLDEGSSGAPVTGGSATIGFQGAGGASAQAYPLTCNGQILEDDQTFPWDDGWSIAPIR